MATKTLTIDYPEDLLLSLKESPEEFEVEARLLLAVKLYEMGRVSTGRAAEIAGMSRVQFIFALDRFGLSPLGQTPEELAEDLSIQAEVSTRNLPLALTAPAASSAGLPGS